MLTFEITKTNTPPTPKGSHPYFDSATPHIRTTSISSVKQSKTNVTHLSRRNKATSASDYRPSRSLSSLQFWKADPIFTRVHLLALRPLHTVWNFRMRFSIFSYSPSFPIKMHATDAKTQKIEPDPKFFWRTKVSEAVCKRDWHNVRSYLFFYVRKFRTQCAETFIVTPCLHRTRAVRHNQIL